MHVNLTYEQFVQELRNWIIKATHLPEDYVFFKKKEKTGITANGDRLFVVCAETDSGKDICGIFVEELYQDYVEGTSMENIEARVKCDLVFSIFPTLSRSHFTLASMFFIEVPST